MFIVMVLPAIVAGVAGLAGGWWANRSARKEAERNRQFQREMSSTSWQRGVEDMRAAGLNPALAYGAGGASSPGGSMAAQSDYVSPSVSSAQAATRLKRELDVMQTQADKNYNDALLSRNMAEESAYRREKVKLEQTTVELNNQLLALQMPWAQAYAAAASKLGRFAAPLSLFQRSGAGPLIGALRGR